MSEFDLLKIKEFGRSCIPSAIGTLYYVWPVKTGTSKTGLRNHANLEHNAILHRGAGFDSKASLKNGTGSSSQINTTGHASLDSASSLISNTDLKTGNAGKIIFFLSNSEKSFDFFINLLSNKFPHCPVIDKPSPEIEKELAGYLRGKTKGIMLEPVYLYGTDFEKKIWETARKIPYGGVASYKELAQKAGYPNAFRAAGTALGNNPLMLVVPCHRVIRSNGEIGYFGGGEEVKLMLLDLEQPQHEEQMAT